MNTTREQYTEEFYLAGHSNGKTSAWAWCKPNGDFQLGAYYVGNDSPGAADRACVKALLEALRHVNPMMRTRIFIQKESVLAYFKSMEMNGAEKVYSTSEANMDLWSDIFQIAKRRLGQIEVRNALEKQNDHSRRAVKYAEGACRKTQ